MFGQSCCEERIAKLLNSRCKCTAGTCFQQFSSSESEMQRFLDMFESRSKLEQDTILHLAWSDASLQQARRREFFFLNKFMRRSCFEAIMGVSSHRIDRIGSLDQRFGSHDRPSKLSASIDAFCLVLYNSVAEPLPNKLLVVILVSFLLLFTHSIPHIGFTPGNCLSLLLVRLVRVGPARRRARVKGADGDSSDDCALQSEFEQNDEELAAYLQTNTSFLLAMTTTGALTALKTQISKF